MDIKTQPRLPELMSVLTTVAIGDLIAAENTPTLKIDMGYWHQPSKSDDGVCYVCFGGSVMAGTLGVADMLYVDPNDFSRWNRSRLAALDHIRRGDLSDAFAEMFPLIDIPDNFPKNREVIEYSDDSEQFKNDMRKIIADLEAAGF